MPAAWLVAAVSIYRMTLAFYLGGHCRFDPSCSVHAQQALRRYGLWGGLARAGHQLLRCHRWGGPVAAPRSPFEASHD